MKQEKGDENGKQKNRENENEELLKRMVISSIGRQLSLEENEWNYKGEEEAKRQVK